jgi:biopolymer transport protein ExbD
LEPRSAEAHENLGSLLAASGDSHGAIAEYSEATRLKPDYAEGHYNLANELFSSGDLEGARAQYRAVVTSSTPGGLGAFLMSELPFKAIPKEIPIHVSDPIKFPILLTILGTDRFEINVDATTKEQLGPRLTDVFASRPDRTIWVRSDHRLSFSELTQVMGITRAAGIETVNLILNR